MHTRWSRIDGACAVNRAGTRRSRGTKWRQSIAGRPVGRCLRSSVGPRRGGLNGRRNAVKPFCHSRRSRVRRGEGYSSRVLRGYRAPLASFFPFQRLPTFVLSSSLFYLRSTQWRRQYAIRVYDLIVGTKECKSWFFKAVIVTRWRGIVFSMTQRNSWYKWKDIVIIAFFLETPF